jgi:hypothetical protein
VRTSLHQPVDTGASAILRHSVVLFNQTRQPRQPPQSGLHEPLRQKIEQSGLDFSGSHGVAQRCIIERLGEGGRFGVAIAAAGAGKTTALKPLVAAWKADGREVYGVSLEWRQADDLTAAGIDQRKVKAVSVLIDSMRGPDEKTSFRPTRKTVIVVDEWGLLGTRHALELLRYQGKFGFSIVALGDDKQCASVEAGAIIDLSRRARGAEQVPEILTTRRQKTERERTISGLFREGRAAEALDMKRADGTVEMAYGGYDGVVARVAKLYRERAEVTGILGFSQLVADRSKIVEALWHH